MFGEFTFFRNACDLRESKLKYLKCTKKCIQFLTNRYILNTSKNCEQFGINCHGNGKIST